MRCTHDTPCLTCLLCPLRTISANALRLRLSLFAVSPGIGVRTAIAVSVILSHIIPLYKKISHKMYDIFGGDKGIRTPGLRIANATLYQLSHIPTSAFFAIFPCCVIIAHYSILTMIFSSFSYNYYFIINI